MINVKDQESIDELGLALGRVTSLSSEIAQCKESIRKGLSCLEELWFLREERDFWVDRLEELCYHK